MVSIGFIATTFAYDIVMNLNILAVVDQVGGFKIICPGIINCITNNYYY